MEISLFGRVLLALREEPSVHLGDLNGTIAELIRSSLEKRTFQVPAAMVTEELIDEALRKMKIARSASA